MKPSRHLIAVAVLSVFALASVVVPMFVNSSDDAVPEPLSVGLMGIGLLGLALVRRR
jgi:hypothetical protein